MARRAAPTIAPGPQCDRDESGQHRSRFRVQQLNGNQSVAHSVRPVNLRPQQSTNGPTLAACGFLRSPATGYRRNQESIRIMLALAARTSCRQTHLRTRFTAPMTIIGVAKTGENIRINPPYAMRSMPIIDEPYHLRSTRGSAMSSMHPSRTAVLIRSTATLRASHGPTRVPASSWTVTPFTSRTIDTGETAPSRRRRAGISRWSGSSNTLPRAAMIRRRMTNTATDMIAP